MAVQGEERSPVVGGPALMRSQSPAGAVGQPSGDVLRRTLRAGLTVGWLLKRGTRGDTGSVSKRERIDPGVLHHDAQSAVLAGLARGDDVYDLIAAAAPSHMPGWFTPDVALLELAVTALDLACPAGVEPLEYAGLRERYLPEVTFRGRVEHRNSQYALYAAACMRGGLLPDVLGDAGWWQTPLWQYAVYAAVIYSRAAAERLDVPLEVIPRQIAARHHVDLPNDGGVR